MPVPALTALRAPAVVMYALSLVNVLTAVGLPDKSAYAPVDATVARPKLVTAFVF